MRRSVLCGLALLGAFVPACERPSRDAPAPEGTAMPGGAAWLAGSTDERFVQVARHLRGFDLAMVETGYRYNELYWAGQDSNWGFAAYHLEKIQTAIQNGLERRPKRAPSAVILDAPLARVGDAIESRDTEAFDRAFDVLTATCNACHQTEQVSFVVVRKPTLRLSPVDGSAPGQPGP